MEYKEFLRHVGKAGLTIREFAELIKINPNSVSNCKTTGVSSHLAIIAALMGEMAEHQIDFTHILARISIEPNKPRGSGFQKKDES